MLYILLEPARLGEDFWASAWPALSAQRQEKVRRFHFARDKVLSAAAFVLLRLALWREYGDATMPDCALAAGGKPFLRQGGVHFSLSHCHQAVACALDAVPLGVDVEPWSSFTPELFGPSMQERIFSPAERASVRRAANPARAACALWVAKESLVKCTGEGIGDDMPQLLQRTDMRVDSYTFAAQELSAAVCRPAHAVSALCTAFSHNSYDCRPVHAVSAPLACHEISPEALWNFLHQVLASAPEA